MRHLDELGFSDYFAAQVDEADRPLVARVVIEHRGAFTLHAAAGERTGRLAGRLRHEATARADLPAVGDWVVTRRVDAAAPDDDLVIDRVLNRRSCFSRKVAGERTEEQIVAANIDTVWIVSALDADLSPRRIERYLTLAWESRARPVLVLNKADLCDDVDAALATVESAAPGVAVHVTSCLAMTGVEDLRQYLADRHTVALLGSSGVGKSTLINALAGADLLRTGAIREADGKGRHTTTHRQLLQVPGGGLIVDTPGMRELQLWDSDGGLADTFGDIEQLAVACRFNDCRHEVEPGCAVLAAVDTGELDASRLDSYHKLQRELAYLDRKQDARAQAEQKQHWRSVHRQMRSHIRHKRR